MRFALIMGIDSKLEARIITHNEPKSQAWIQNRSFETGHEFLFRFESRRICCQVSLVSIGGPDSKVGQASDSFLVLVLVQQYQRTEHGSWRWHLSPRGAQ